MGRQQAVLSVTVIVMTSNAMERQQAVRSGTVTPCRCNTLDLEVNIELEQ